MVYGPPVNYVRMNPYVLLFSQLARCDHEHTYAHAHYAHHMCHVCRYVADEELRSDQVRGMLVVAREGEGRRLPG